MELRPIVSVLMRNKAGLALIVLQVAITLAVICNSLFIVAQRSERVGRASGMDEAGTFTIDSLGFASGFDVRDSIQADLALLRSLPGVISASAVNTVPLSGSGWNTGLSREPLDPSGDRTADGRRPAMSALYMTDEQALRSFGLDLVEGREFTTQDVGSVSQEGGVVADSVIVTEALANALFPDESAVGKQVFGIGNDNHPMTIVGVIRHLQMPWIGTTDIDQSALVPVLSADGSFSRYLVRTAAADRDRAMAEVEAALQASNPGRLVRRLRSLEEIRASAYRQDRAMMSILTGTMLAMLAITGLGIVGMTSFWVARRTKQIGTRRALGARRADIRRYFQTENGLMIALGVALGGLLTYAFNAWLMQNFDAERLPWYYLPVGALLMLALGQLAVFAPAGRAAAVPPAVATRTA